MQFSSKPVVAFFLSDNAAHQAALSLQSAGLGSARIDPVSNRGSNEDPYYESPIDSTLTSILPTAYTYSAGEVLTDAERQLNITNPSANSYLNTNYEAALTLSTTEDKAGRAVEIIKENGGYF